MKLCFCRNNNNSLQEILVPQKLLENLKIPISGSGKLLFDNIEFLGTFWPREDSSNLLCVHDLIRNSGNIHKLLILSEDSSVSESNIIPLRTVKITKISVRVVFKSLESVLPYASEKCRQSLSSKARGILFDLIISPGFTIKTDEMELGNLLNIQCIDILTSNAGPMECGAINPKTKIIIDDVVTEEQYFKLEKPTNLKIGGLKNELELLEDIVKLSSKRDIFLPKTILLKGPSGCGKTLLVQEVCRKFKAQLLSSLSSYLIGAYPGETEENIRNIFRKALEYSKYTLCILSIEEIDCLLVSKDSQSRRFVTLIDKMMDEIRYEANILCICTTSKANDLTYLPKFDKEVNLI